MKKILKRLLISTALITPIAISTPLLLTSCSTNAELSDTGPSIFKGAYGLELFAGDSNKSKGYYLKAELNKGNNLNEIFTKVLNEVPESPKFNDIAKLTSTLFNLGTFEVNKAPTVPAGLTNEVNYSEYKLPNQQLSESGKSAAISKIFENIVFKSTDNTADSTNDKNVLAYFPSTAFDLDKFKNDITYDVVYTVKQDDIKDNSGKITKRVILSDISFSFKLKDTSKSWAYLKTSDPIFVSISWTDDSKATLFKGGFKSAPEITTTSGVKTINFTGKLNKSVFGSDASKIDNTEKLKKWFEGKTGDLLSGTGTGTITGPNGDLSTANKNVVNKIKQIFDNIDKKITNPGIESAIKAKTPVEIENANLTEKFIKGINQTNPGAKATEPVALGSGNVEVSITKIAKKDSKAGELTIELEFKLSNDNGPEWYGLTGEAAKLPIKFILDVSTTETPSEGTGK